MNLVSNSQFSQVFKVRGKYPHINAAVLIC